MYPSKYIIIDIVNFKIFIKILFFNCITLWNHLAFSCMQSNSKSKFFTPVLNAEVLFANCVA